MEPILILVLDYLPIKQADAICMSRIISMLKNTYEIHVVTLGDEQRNVIQDGVHIHGLTSGANIDRVLLRKINNSTLRKVTKALIRCFKGVYWPDSSIHYKKMMTEECARLHNELHFASMICLSGSFTVQMVGCAIKKRFSNLQYISMQYDPYPVDSFIFKYNINVIKKRHIASATNKYADQLALLLTRLTEYQTRYPTIKRKSYGVGLPLVEDMKIEPKERTQTIEMLFIGSMNLNVRSPEYWFRAVAASKYKERIHISIVGAAEDVLKEMAKKIGIYKNCDFIRYVPREQLREYYSRADYLVSIIALPGARLMPNKVLEYTTTGLPIISFEDVTENVAGNILAAYENSLRIDTRKSFPDNCSEFDEYIGEKHSGIPFSEYTAKVNEYTPEWNAEKIITVINDYRMMCQP